MWTLTHYTSYALGVFQLSNGNISNFNNTTENDVYPAVYLKLNVKIIGGEGTESSPYELSL